MGTGPIQKLTRAERAVKRLKLRTKIISLATSKTLVLGKGKTVSIKTGCLVRVIIYRASKGSEGENEAKASLTFFNFIL